MSVSSLLCRENHYRYYRCVRQLTSAFVVDSEVRVYWKFMSTCVLTWSNAMLLQGPHQCWMTGFCAAVCTETWTLELVLASCCSEPKPRPQMSLMRPQRSVAVHQVTGITDHSTEVDRATQHSKPAAAQTAHAASLANVITSVKTVDSTYLQYFLQKRR